MKKLLLACLSIAVSSAFAQTSKTISDPVEYVNPMMGTMSKPSLSTGNTYPIINASANSYDIRYVQSLQITMVKIIPKTGSAIADC